MAESVSLAVLENLVHMAREDFPVGYVVVTAMIPDEIRIATEEDLLVRFRGISQRELGDQWIDGRDSALLKVAPLSFPSTTFIC